MTQGTTPKSARAVYLERLEDLLPAREAARIRDDVEAMILDRVEAELEAQPALDPREAESRAIRSMGEPESLADQLGPSPFTISRATRQAFLRSLAVVVPIHLLLSAVLGLSGQTQGASALLAPLPLSNWLSTILSVIGIVLLDIGAVFTFFWLRRGRATRAPFVAVPTELVESRGDAWKGLAMTGLLGILLNFFATDSIFVLRVGKELHPFLAEPLRTALPLLNVPLALFALRHLVVLVRRGKARRPAIVCDALGSLTAAGVLGWLCTRSPLVSFPASIKNPEAAEVMNTLVSRVFLICFALGVLLFLVRVVRSVARFHRAAVR